LLLQEVVQGQERTATPSAASSPVVHDCPSQPPPAPISRLIFIATLRIRLYIFLKKEINKPRAAKFKL
jgi:hypothetical protein